MPTSTLMRRHPPGGPFLLVQKGTKDTPKRGDFDFPLFGNTLLKRPNTRGAAAPLIGSNPPGERNLGASASEYYAQGKATREPCKNPPRRAEGGIRGELVPARKARLGAAGDTCSAEHVRALCPPLPAFFWVLFLAEQEKYKRPYESRGPDVVLPKHASTSGPSCTS